MEGNRGRVGKGERERGAEMEGKGGKMEGDKGRVRKAWKRRRERDSEGDWKKRELVRQKGETERGTESGGR